MKHARAVKYIFFILVLLILPCQYCIAAGRRTGGIDRNTQQPGHAKARSNPPSNAMSQKKGSTQRNSASSSPSPSSTVNNKATSQEPRQESTMSPASAKSKGSPATPMPSSPPSISITPTEFITALHACGYALPNYEQYRYFKEGLHQSQISSRREMAMFFAQVMHESNGLTENVESRCATNPTVACASDYIHPKLDVPQQQYFGRGYIQLTWSYNYKAASAAIFGDDRLLVKPATILSSEKLMWLVSFWYWDTFVHSIPEVTQQGAFGATTMAINGIQECQDPKGHPVARARYKIYVKVCQILGVDGPLNPMGCYPCPRYDDTYNMKSNKRL